MKKDVSKKQNNVIWHDSHIKRADRNLINNHNSGLVWFTGLSASGKSTIAHHVEKELFRKGMKAYVLDGDNMRHGLNENLGFSRDDRRENLRRAAEVSRLFVDAGMIVLAAFISPSNKDREYVRGLFKGDIIMEIFIKCSLEECERRDPNGQYKKARAGIIKDYTGISTPYEEPEKPDLTINTENTPLEDAVDSVLELIRERLFLNER